MLAPLFIYERIHMRIQGSGPLDAKIVVVQDHPSYPEKATAKPIAGTSENALKMWWRTHNVYRNDVRVENLYEFLPAGNTIESVPIDTMVGCIADFELRMSRLKAANVIVPMGEYSTFALTGRGKVKAKLRQALGETGLTATMAEKKAGVNVLRGSTYFYPPTQQKVIPTIHPKEIIKFAQWRNRTKRDWRIICEEEQHTRTSSHQVERLHISNPTQYELNDFWKSLDPYKHKLSIDIETWGKSISCVGFSINPKVSYTLPTITKAEKEFYFPWIEALCGCSVPKILQGGWYDAYWLDDKGIKINNYVYDTMCMHHALDPIESHDLAFLASFYTRNNYWKDEAKDAEEIKKYASNLSALWTYNGLDCCITHEISDILERELRSRGMWQFYMRHYATMLEPLVRVMRHGVNVDVKRQKAWAVKLVKQADGLRKELAVTAGEDLYAEKGFSPIKLKRFFYETLKLPEQKKYSKQKAGRVQITSIDETAIKRMTLKFPKKIGNQGLKVLKVRSLNKKASVLKKGWDKDGRIRCTYKLTTKQGRLSSSKNPMGRGYNLQNIEREKGGIRTTFIPDDGCIFVRVDLSQSEDRFCKMYTRSPRMVEIANRRPCEYDAHIDNAKIIFGNIEITKELRDVAKMGVHASQRKMTGKTLSDRLMAKMDMIKTPRQCQTMIDRYLKTMHEISEVYFPFVRTQIINGGILCNSWGRMIDFNGYMIDQNIYREGYSFYLQSENVDLLNQKGFKVIHKLIAVEKLKSNINMQTHDDLVISCPPDEAYHVAHTLVTSLEEPRMIMGNALSVPACTSIGFSLDSGEMFEWKELPGQKEFDNKIQEMWKEKFDGYSRNS